MATTDIKVERVAGAMGAVMTGVDLSGEPSNATFAAVREALVEHQVVFIRDQDLDAPGLVRVARLLGELNIYPFVEGLADAPEIFEILKAEEDSRNFGGGWHSDSTYLDEPPAFTMLYAKEVPAVGGDTLYANTYLAYESLSPGLQKTLCTLDGVNSAALGGAGGRAKITSENSAMKRQNMIDADTIEAIHPIVAKHPDTGRRALYLNRAHTVRFDGMTAEESKPMINYLADKAVRPDFTCRMRWEVGTLGIWDNRCTQHYALNDYPGQRRRMWRATVRA
jgi:taurine dioxygenase